MSPREAAAAEPSVERYAGNPVGKYLAATRPPFLAVSLVPALIGLSAAHYAGAALLGWAVALTVTGAVIAHAGINVLNDYYDALNGSDDANTERLYPYTGGSRFIQNGVLTRGQVRRYGVALLAVAALIGLVLTVRAGVGVVMIGLTGLLLGWAYSAPPLALNSRGLGELCTGLGVGIFIPVGAYFVQRLSLDPLPLYAGAAYALLAANLLYINQFPDYRADKAAGRRHWVVRLGVRRARWGYLLTVLAAYVGLTGMVGAGLLPSWCLLGLLTLPLSLHAARGLVRYGETPERLGPAIRASIGALLGHGLLMSAGLWLATTQG